MSAAERSGSVHRNVQCACVVYEIIGRRKRIKKFAIVIWL